MFVYSNGTYYKVYKRKDGSKYTIRNGERRTVGSETILYKSRNSCRTKKTPCGTTNNCKWYKNTGCRRTGSSRLKTRSASLRRKSLSRHRRSAAARRSARRNGSKKRSAKRKSSKKRSAKRKSSKKRSAKRKSASASRKRKAASASRKRKAKAVGVSRPNTRAAARALLAMIKKASK